MISDRVILRHNIYFGEDSTLVCNPTTISLDNPGLDKWNGVLDIKSGCVWGSWQAGYSRVADFKNLR